MTTAIIYLFVGVCIAVFFAAVRWLVKPILSRLVMTPIMVVFCVPMILSANELSQYLLWHRTTLDARAQIKAEKLDYDHTETKMENGAHMHTRLYSKPGSSTLVRVPEFSGGKRLVSSFSVLATAGVSLGWLGVVLAPSFMRWQKKQRASVKPIEATKPDKQG
ncbi:MAG: hypothetical protein H6815_06265 [Phycisphaeraceae bacterium]|nr:hypothetical protein [Phycisphaerales bacterium]MCB9860043.1 hypothetical protein [Phycisphaeraceae bacterium]